MCLIRGGEELFTAFVSCEMCAPGDASVKATEMGSASAALCDVNEVDATTSVVDWTGAPHLIPHPLISPYFRVEFFVL